MRIAWGSCDSAGRILTAGHVIAALQPDLFIAQGDTPYINSGAGTTLFGVTRAVISKTSVAADIFTHHQQMHANPGWRALRAAVPDFWLMADDHEWGGDNWDHTVTQANSVAGLNLSTANQAEVDFHWNEARQACELAVAAYANNPANNDAGVAAEKPSNADAATAASNYPPRYFRKEYGALAEVFSLDCISHRSPVAATDDSSKTMLGSVQKAWLKARLRASTATWKIIGSPKKTFIGSPDNGDTFGAYTAERAELLDYIAAQGITGVIWISGDRHWPHVIATSTAAGDTYNHVCICACPIAVGVNAAPGLVNGIRWQAAPGRNAFGLIEVASDMLKIEVREAETGAVLWRGDMLPGTNALRARQAGIGV